MESTPVKDLWFNTLPTETLCRAGGNGENHPTQMFAILKYVTKDQNILDIGCGSGTTIEALIKAGYNPRNYKGVDFIPHHIKWCKNKWPEAEFQVQNANKLDEADNSWDVVHSRHVVDHLLSFEAALDEHCRVAKSIVIITLWVPMQEKGDHQIKPIIIQGITYPTEFTNSFSEELVRKALKEKEDQGWKTELHKDVGAEVSGFNTVIILRR